MPDSDLKIARTPDGVVVRVLRPDGEHAYRQGHDGSWSFTCDHKGPWISIAMDQVPSRINLAAGS